jgi:hypothetical protein
VYLGAGLFAWVVTPGSGLDVPLKLWAIQGLLPSLLALTLLVPRIRSVAPLVFVVAALAYLGASTSFALIAAETSRTSFEPGFDASVPLVIGGGMFAGALVGLGFLFVLRFGYLKKWLSDEAITLDAAWTLVLLVETSPAAFEGGPVAVPLVLSFLVYKLVSLVPQMLLLRRETGHTLRLLFLRSFSSSSLWEGLFRSFSKSWRYAGTLRMIGGPDLATTHVEPHEILDFAFGRLQARFIDDPHTLEAQVAAADARPDLDGRFRVSEFFCRGAIWPFAFRRLVADSDAVLMDLRGFSPATAGVRFELEQLAWYAPLERVILIVDERTDQGLVAAILDGALQARRAAGTASLEGPHVVRPLGSLVADVPKLLEAVCRVALVAPQPLAVAHRPGVQASVL